MIGIGIGVTWSAREVNRLNTLTRRYAQRVIADGGTVEAINCVNSAYYNKYNWDYYFRVVDDGGVVESLECVPLY